MFLAADAEGTVFRVHITFDRQKEFPKPKADLSRGVLGLDENPHGIALANVGPHGNLEPFPKEFSLPEIVGSRKFSGDIQAGLNPRGTIWGSHPEQTDCPGGPGLRANPGEGTTPELQPIGLRLQPRQGDPDD